MSAGSAEPHFNFLATLRLSVKRLNSVVQVVHLTTNDSEYTDGMKNGPQPSAASYVLIDEDRVAVRVHGHETGRAGGAFVGLTHQLHALGLELAL